MLREKLVSADMGITGANFLVAETGTVTLDYERGQRAVLHLSAAGSGVHNWHGEDSAIHGRPGHLHSAAAPGGHRPAHKQLRYPRLRPKAVRR